MPVDIPRKANLGCGPLPLYRQDAKYMGIDPNQALKKTLEEWILIDLYIKGPGVTNWDIEDLKQIPDGWLEEIYCSHALEHISHRNIQKVLAHWYEKMMSRGTITINVPDLMYAYKQLRFLENDQVPDGLYNTFYGLHGVMSIIFGTHSQPGEYHLCGFTKHSLEELLIGSGFEGVEVIETFDDHQMGVLIGKAIKP